MRILQFCHKPPLPSVDGGCIAMNNMTSALLAAGHSVQVFAISTPKHAARALPVDYCEKTHFETVFVDTTPQKFAAARALLCRQSYHVKRFVSKNVIAKLSTILQQNEFDVVLLESLFVTPYIPVIQQLSKAKIVLRTHNIEHKIWERIWQHEPNLLRRWLLKAMTKRLKKFELAQFDKIDAFMAISGFDFDYFHRLFPALAGAVIPFCIDIDAYEDDSDYIPSDTPELFHIGSMDWMPNIEGLQWFLDEVWGEVHHRFPSVTFTLAGRNMGREFLSLQLPNVQVVGEVADAHDFMRSKDIMVVPLLSGSGVRIKIIEGMALGKTIITTTIGAEGLAVEHGKNILIADTPEMFVEILQKCVNNPDICKLIGENARNFVALNHNIDLIGQRIEQLFAQM